MVVLSMLSTSVLDILVGLLFGALGGGRSDTDTCMWAYRKPLGLHCRGAGADPRTNSAGPSGGEQRKQGWGVEVET